MFFTNTSYDAASMTFRGVIDWHAGADWCVAGEQQWTYEIVFDDSFNCIIGVEVKGLDCEKLLEHKLELYIEGGNEFAAGLVEKKLDNVHVPRTTATLGYT